MEKRNVENEMKTTSSLFNIEDEDIILKPITGYSKIYNRIYINFTEDLEDGTWLRVSDYIRFYNKVKDFNYKSIQNFLIGKRKSYDYGDFVLSKEGSEKLKITFKEPKEIIITEIIKNGNHVPIFEKVKSIVGLICWEFYYIDKGRQDKVPNGIELFIEDLEYFG